MARPTPSGTEAPLVASDAFQRHAGIIRAWREDPVRFVENELGAKPDPGQLEPLRCLDPRRNVRRIALRASKGVGKSAFDAWAILHFLATRPRPKIVVTSITGENLRDTLWAELSKWGQRSKILRDLFDFGTRRIEMRYDRKQWFVTARTWRRDADAEQQEQTLAGYHAEFMMFVMDEAGGIPSAVGAAAKAALSTGTEVKYVLSGNPTHLSGPLYDAFHREAANWHKFHLHAIPGHPERSARVSEEWALEMRDEYGEDSAWYYVNVRGDFPEGSSDALIPVSHIRDAYLRQARDNGDPLELEPRVLGLDVARYGTDPNRACIRGGDTIEDFVSWYGLNTSETAAKASELRRERRCELIRCDSIGVGAGVYDKLVDLGEPVEGIQVSETADQEDEYFNLRSELAGELRRRFMLGNVAIAPELERRSEFEQEASTIRVGFDERGRLKLQRKDDYRRKHKKSPNYLDGAMLAFADGFAAGIIVAGDAVDNPRPRPRRVPLDRYDSEDGWGAKRQTYRVRRRKAWAS